MQRIQEFRTIKEASSAIYKIACSLATVYDCQFIASDARIELDTMLLAYNDCKKAKCLQGCTVEHPFRWYFAVREKGCEASDNKQRVISRLHRLGNPVFTMTVNYIYGDSVKVRFYDLRNSNNN